MKAVVTGGTGFIGRHLAIYLYALGMDVIVIDRHMSPSQQTPGIQYASYDIRDPALSGLFAWEKPDILCHLAAQKSVVASMESPVNDAAENIMGTIQLLDLAANFGVKHFLFTSTAAVYGMPYSLPIDEQHSLQPVSFYGLSKSAAESYIQMYAQQAGFHYSIFRLANVYGPLAPSQEPNGIIQLLFDHIAKNKPFPIYGSGTQTRDFIHVTDVVNAFIQAIQLKRSGIMNLSSNCATSVNELINYIAILTGEIPDVHHTAKREGDITHSQLDNSLAKKTLNWQPQLSMEEGLKQSISPIPGIR